MMRLQSQGLLVRVIGLVRNVPPLSILLVVASAARAESSATAFTPLPLHDTAPHRSCRRALVMPLLPHLRLRVHEVLPSCCFTNSSPPLTPFALHLSAPLSDIHVHSASTLASVLSRYVALTLSSLVTYFTLAAAFDRPQGSLAVPPGTLCMKQSQVNGAGLGLYSEVSLPEGTILGTYPGVMREASAYLGKYGRYPQCGSYAWRFTDNESYIDPTDAQGNIADLCYGGSELVPGSLLIHEKVLSGGAVPTLLARVNEPPVGGPGCNIFAREDLDKRQVTFSTSRDVSAGEELFMDYGLTYDRTGYGHGGT